LESQDFTTLTFDRILEAAEWALQAPFTGYTFQLPSYINRVYELQSQDGDGYVIKFYRPGRWSREAIEEEHAFIFDCHEAEIPVIAPLQLANGTTLGEAEGIYFTLFPKRFGRAVDIETDRMFLRIGTLLGRVHAVAGTRDAPARTVCHPQESTAYFVHRLLEGGFVTRNQQGAFEAITGSLLERITPLFAGCRLQRIHGDCHRGNILDRKGERLYLFDFDDMMTGPPVQDMLLLLPDHAHNVQREIDLILRGYEQFCTFDRSTLRLIEPLRAMRMIYFIAWCSTQVDDLQFRDRFPDWGSESFWEQEIQDLRQLMALMAETGVC
jgi:Ser/Thr protein kinase RdoA (MazF antagonist)